MWPVGLTTCLLLVSSFSSLVCGDGVRGFRGRDVERAILRRYAKDLVQGSLERRQVSTQTNANSSMWNEQTTAACMSSLAALNGKASNPAGMAVCYNLPFLDNSTGVFQADLRLYQIATPSGEFTGIPPQNIQVNLQYFGAEVQSISPSELKPRDVLPRSVSEDNGMEKRQAMTPTLLEAYAFVGQIRKDLMLPNMDVTNLTALLIPIVSLTATSPTNTLLNTTLSSDEAAFVNGIFSDQLSPAEAAAAAATAAAAAAEAAANAPFILPGTRILVFPIGAIVTGVWALLGLATVVWGTVGRIQFREQYRRRVVRMEKGGVARI